MAMKKNLLSIVQSILSAMDSENVNSIGDSVEAEQVVDVCETVYYELIATRTYPEHRELLQPDPASDSEHPTHFLYGENVKDISLLWYEDKSGTYQEVCFNEPEEFLRKTDGITGSDYMEVLDKSGGTKLRIRNDQDPRFYTSFDNEWIVMNSWDSDVEDTLQGHKVRALGYKYPVFSRSDTYVPDLDTTQFPHYIAECKSTAMSLLKGGSDPKIEQAARRQKSYRRNDKYNTVRPNVRNNYGR